MANIRQRGKKFVYTWDDPVQPYKVDPKTGIILTNKKTGKPIRNQHMRTFNTLEEGEIFKHDLEIKIKKGKYISPSNETLEAFVPRFLEVYAPLNWSGSTYSGNMSAINNHILPDLGPMLLRAITPDIIETHMARLKKKKVLGYKSYNKDYDNIPTLSDKYVRDIYDLLKNIFRKAVEWKVIEENPVQCERPRIRKKNRAMRKAWSKANLRTALENMHNEILYDLVFLAFFCTTRNGETVSITLDAIDLNDGDFGSININKTMKRIPDSILAKLPNDDIQFRFPKKVETSKSTLVLKDPKTDLSSRKVYLTQKGRERIIQRMQLVCENKALLGEKYHDYNLLFCLPDGDPIEPNLCEKWFRRWQERSKLDLPQIVFHELRHTSITYKIYISGGDVKSVGLQAGQNNVQTTEGYNHGFEENQRELARLTELDFWGDAQLVDDDQLLSDEGVIPVEFVKQLFEDRMGQAMTDPSEFDSAIEYLNYVMDALEGKESPSQKKFIMQQSA